MGAPAWRRPSRRQKRAPEVTLLEKNPYLGGTTSIAVGSFTACGTSLQRAAGVTDNPEDHVEDMLAFAGKDRHLANVALHRVLAQEGGATFEWLRSFGVQFVGPFPEPPNRVPRMHNVIPTAKAYIATLQAQALRLGVTIHTGARVISLMQDDNGRVSGVTCRLEGREGQLMAQRGVILAAGDYSNDPALKRRFGDDEAAGIDGINPTATGDGHAMGLAAGADVVNMPLMLGPQIRFVPPARRPFAQLLPSNPTFARLAALALRVVPRKALNWYAKSLLVTWTAPEPALYAAGTILVNQRGERFVDETGARREREIPRQPEKVAYLVFDQRIADQFSRWPHFVSTAPDIAYAYVQDYRIRRPDLFHQGATPAELARSMGADPEVLERTIARRQRRRGSRWLLWSGRPRSLRSPIILRWPGQPALLCARSRKSLDRTHRRRLAD